MLCHGFYSAEEGKTVRRLFSLLLVLLFLSCTIDVALGDAVPNGMRILSCPEGHFSTLVDFDCETEFREGDGLYIYTYKQGWFPYILVHVGWLDGRILDGETYIREKLIPDYQDSYGANGPLVITQHGDFTIGGHSAAAVDVQYHRASDGMKIYFLTVIDRLLSDPLYGGVREERSVGGFGYHCGEYAR